MVSNNVNTDNLRKCYEYNYTQNHLDITQNKETNKQENEEMFTLLVYL